MITQTFRGNGVILKGDNYLSAARYEVNLIEDRYGKSELKGLLWADPEQAAKEDFVRAMEENVGLRLRFEEPIHAIGDSIPIITQIVRETPVTQGRYSFALGAD